MYSPNLYSFSPRSIQAKVINIEIQIKESFTEFPTKILVKHILLSIFEICMNNI